MVDGLALVLGIFIVGGTAGSLVRSTVMPRSVASRLSVFVGRRLVYGTVLRVSHLFNTYETKDRVLVVRSASRASHSAGDLARALAVRLRAHLVVLARRQSWSRDPRERSSLFTLGFAGQEQGIATAVDFMAAFTGLIVIALQIAYLPVLYQAFNRRETVVTMLQSRAGAPAWGPEILARAQLVDLVDELKALYAEWERWAAEVMESHTTYTVLIWFRSPHALRSWVLGLLAVLDAAALHSAFAPSTVPSEARLVLRMGFTCLRNIAEVLGIHYDPDPFPDDPIDLTYEQFIGGARRLEEAGFSMERSVEEAWPHFRGWRINYESIAYVLAAPLSRRRGRGPDLATTSRA